MRRRWAPGLRARIVAALVLTTGLTLGVAAIALLSPLEPRVRNNELRALLDYSKSLVDFETVQLTAIAGTTGTVTVGGN